MSTLKQQHVVNPEITEESIAAYLQANPEFFERHSTLLNSLRLPHNAGGPAVSLVERQILVLRQKNLKLENKLKELVDIARSNDTLAARIHSLAMLMLAAPDQAGVIQVLEEQLRVSFNADRSMLVVFDTPAERGGRADFCALWAVTIHRSHHSGPFCSPMHRAAGRSATHSGTSCSARTTSRSAQLRWYRSGYKPNWASWQSAAATPHTFTRA